MSADFFDYVRGRTESVPAGHSEAGMRVYRHLVFLGVAQLVETHYPTLRSTLGEVGWRTLLEDFIRKSTWTSNYYADLSDAFLAYLEREKSGMPRAN